jgi:hypothetical protein
MADCPTVKEALAGETATDGAVFTVTVMTFEATVAGVVALSVTWSTRYHTPAVMLFDVGIEQLGEAAPGIGE